MDIIIYSLGMFIFFILLYTVDKSNNLGNNISKMLISFFCWPIVIMIILIVNYQKYFNK